MFATDCFYVGQYSVEVIKVKLRDDPMCNQQANVEIRLSEVSTNSIPKWLLEVKTKSLKEKIPKH